MNNVAKSYGFEQYDNTATATAMADAQGNKAVQEIQAALIMAKKFPRNSLASLNRIINACKRPFLAEQALYAYPKGGAMVTGPSIRLAEVLAQSWGNISCGIREISQSNGVSEVEAFAWDLETNSQSTKIFHVPHVRHTKKGSYKITDPREIYEMVANQGARRLRACILAVIPGDVVDAAVEQIKRTLASNEEPIAERINRLSMAFDEMGITVTMLEERLGHALSSTIETELVNLRAIYKSIKDGVATREQFFNLGGSVESKNAKQNLEKLLANKTSEPKKPKPKKRDPNGKTLQTKV